MKDLKFDFVKGILVKNKAPVLIKNNDVYVQNIKIEAITVEGDLWHDRTYGWSLVDFMHRNIDEMLKIELYQRVKDKLAKRPYIDVASIKIALQEREDSILLKVSFYIEEESISFVVDLNRVKGEVVLVNGGEVT